MGEWVRRREGGVGTGGTGKEGREKGGRHTEGRQEGKEGKKGFINNSLQIYGLWSLRFYSFCAGDGSSLSLTTPPPSVHLFTDVTSCCPH